MVNTMTEGDVNMQISWFLGFGWVSIVTLVVSGVAINMLSGPIVWVMYAPFLIVALYMTVRFRLFTMHPWRRVHSKTMLKFAKFAVREHDSAKADGREYDIRKPCEALLDAMFDEQDRESASLLSEEQRKNYYRGLVAEFPDVFLKSFTSSDPKTILQHIDKDIEASEIGPDVLITRGIELKYSRKEAATYLQSLMLGTVR